MKIAIGATVSKATTILAPGGLQGPSNLLIEAVRQYQTVLPLRANVGRTIQRKNVITRVSFDVTFGYATYILAEENVLIQTALTIDSGVLVLTCSGGTDTIRYMADASIETIRATQLGVSVKYSYVIVGGSMSAVAPVI